VGDVYEDARLRPEGKCSISCEQRDPRSRIISRRCSRSPTNMVDRMSGDVALDVPDQSATDIGAAFEERTASLLRLLGFAVERDILSHGRQIDLRATAQRGPFLTRYLVECKGTAARVTTADLDSLYGRLRAVQNNGYPTMRGMLVAQVGFVKEAKAQAEALGIELVTANELERSLVDLSRMVDAQLAELREDRGVREFVEPHVKTDGRIEPESAMRALEQCIADPTKNHLTLLGDFGIGKTTLLRRLSVRFAERFLASPSVGPAPIYVDLREYSHISLRQIILDLFDRQRIELASFEAFAEVLKNGQVVLILDGFDEIASKASTQVTLETFAR
jgi:tRNA A37 threonylcarbamoyladenosine biosynthesis protein TsaE